MMRCVVTQAVKVIAFAAFVLLGGDAPRLNGKTEILIWHGMEGKLGEAFGELVKQFNKSQTEFEAEAVYKKTYPEAMTSAINAYQQGNGPHIIQVYEAGTQTMLLSGAIIPIYRLMQQEPIKIDWSDFIETVKAYYSKDGKLYSMPFNSSTAILYYNKDIFKKAGLADKPPRTWQEVETMSKKILNAGAAACGFTTPSSSWTMLENTFAWHDQPFATNQNGYTGVNDTELRINSEFGLKHIEALAKWQKNKIFVWQKEFTVDGRMERERPERKFLDGECAMLIWTSEFIGLQGKSFKFNWGTGQLPHWGPRYAKTNTILGGATLWVLRGHEPGDYEGVAKFMEFIAEPCWQTWWAVKTGFIPITKTAIKNLEDGSFFKKHPEHLTALNQLRNARPTQNSRGIRLGSYLKVREAIEQELESIFTGKKKVKEALDWAVIRGNAILKEFGVTQRPLPRRI
jgi:sn-glycerol 3-phosphate transport system substrate-binding protein